MHYGIVMSYNTVKGQHWLKLSLVTYLQPDHYMNQCWLTVNWTLRNKLLLNFDQNERLEIKENVFENVICRMLVISFRPQCFNSSPPGQNGRLFADDIFRCIYTNEKFCILVKISLNLVRKGPNDNNPALVQVMAWHRIGNKPLSEPMLAWITSTYIPGLGADELIGFGLGVYWPNH